MKWSPLLAQVEVHIRRPPCKFCTGGWAYSSVFADTQVVCPRCYGRAGVVEYSMFVACVGGVKVWWLGWPTEEQRLLEGLVAEATRR